MDPSYETVVDTTGLVWTLLAYLIHGAVVFAHVGLAGFLVWTGLREVLSPDRARVFGALRLVLGLLLFVPLATGAPVGVSLAAAVAAFALLVWGRRGPTPQGWVGRFARRTAIVFAVVTALFMIWEREDNLALAADVLLPAMEWRNEELTWQLGQDPLSPKVGDLAPDFELQDPQGVTRVRLSEFRGKRPVALVFGSYT